MRQEGIKRTLNIINGADNPIPMPFDRFDLEAIDRDLNRQNAQIFVQMLKFYLFSNFIDNPIAIFIKGYVALENNIPRYSNKNS